MIRHPPSSPLFPSPPLSRSVLLQLLRERAARELDGGGELSPLGGTEALDRFELGARLEHASDALVPPEQVAREIDRTLAAHAGAKQHRHELGIAQRRSAGREQPFARPLLGPPVGDPHGLAYNPHPLNGCRAMALTGKRILLGLTGGIAAYKAAELARLLVKRGADVRVAMTEAATRFITPLTMQALTGQPVWTDLCDPRVSDAMGHIELSRDREIVVIAPASADFMAKLANGSADDLLSSLCLARRCRPA